MNKERVRVTLLRTAFALGTGLTLLGLTAPAAFAAEPVLPPGAGLTSWHANGAHGRYVVQMIHGDLPGPSAHASHGTVISDTDCTADAEHLSHCHNVIVLDNAARVTIANHHQMNLHRCLRPGESVWIAPLAEGWAVVQTHDGNASGRRP